ncbi:MAG TPA: PAS domain S-box protein [Steroidobacteraceae bacterium]|nr:PAS domain S-box protein [Steroidobacteraceae bacterium]
MQIGLFAVFATLLVVSAASYRALLAAKESQEWVTHSNEIRVQLAKLDWAIENTQAASRAYALSGEAELLRAALASRSRADEQRIVLLALMADNPDQLRRLGALAGLANPIALEAAKTIGNGSMAAELEAYRKVPGEIEHAELQLLAERESETERHFRQVRFSVALGSVIGLVFFGLASENARRDNAAMTKSRTDNDERMRVLVDGVQDYAIFMLDPKGTVVSWNDGARRNKGYHAAEIIGQNFSRFYPQADIDAGLPEAELVMAAANGRSEVERWRVRKDGSRFLASMVFTAARDSAGALIGFSEISRDISERKDTDAKYRGLLEAAPDAMVVVDQGGKIVLLNVQAEKQFGYRRDELVGQRITDIVPEGFAERLIADGTRNAADALAQQIDARIELSGRRKDGSDFPIEITLSPLESKEGILVTAAIRDISARKEVEAHLAEMESRYRGLLEAAPEAIVISDPNGRILLVNAQMEKVFGYRREELIGQAVEILVPERFRAKHPEYRIGYHAHPRARLMGESLDLRGLRKDASEFPVEITLSPLESPEGLLVTAVVRDVTERKKFQEHLLQTVGELKRSNDELEHFAYVASHDLQEPLRMVASYTQLLAKRYKGRLDSDADDFIAYAVAGCNRMQRLINDLLAYSRAGANGKTPRKISSELALRAALNNLETSIAESGALVTHDPLPIVTMDDTQLTQVFQNLIGNAVKYRSAAAPRVHVSAATSDGNECVFSVRDNGVGINSQYFEKIFILFQRLHGRDEFEGTGIGLAVCKKMIERLGGRIWLDSQPDKGSTFHFAVPEGITK